MNNIVDFLKFFRTPKDPTFSLQRQHGAAVVNPIAVFHCIDHMHRVYNFIKPAIFKKNWS